MKQSLIRNFCIIAHIDHGKSTLADRLLEYTGTIEPQKMQEQFLDQMPLEREHGVTIKASAVRMFYRTDGGQAYELNLIDTPGHVDFSYEVSRTLTACEGAVLVVDASQGIQAQTLANLYQALEHKLVIIPVANKIDLPSANPDKVAQELSRILDIPSEQVIRASAKEGIGTLKLLEAVVKKVPPPSGDGNAPLRALIFDAHYDAYKGVVTYVRVMDGSVTKEAGKLRLMSTGEDFEALEIGVFAPQMQPIDRLVTGEVGYIATGLKELGDVPVGDTVTLAERPALASLPGYREVKPMVFAGFYPAEGEDYQLLRDALDKLRLNDGSLSYQPETSAALGFGFRCGFLGLFHMQIVQERLEREYGLNIVATVPNVEYRVRIHQEEEIVVDSPAKMPPEGEVQEIREPWMAVSVFTPAEHIGPVIELVKARRGQFQRMEYLDEARVMLLFEMPLSEMIIDFYDQLKSKSRGYASLDYSFLGYRPGELVRLDILVHGKAVDALSSIVHRDQSLPRGQALVKRLKEVIPRQQFPVALQAAVGNHIIARETIRALAKFVTGKCYGGDRTRKEKLWQKQKAGKKRLKMVGQVEIPQEAFLALLKLSDEQSRG